MQRRAILAMVWLVGCGGVDPQEALSAAPVPGEIIQPDLTDKKRLSRKDRLEPLTLPMLCVKIMARTY